MLADAGSMIFMDGDTQVETDCYGGCCTALARTCAGESCCQNQFSASNGTNKVGFGFVYPGDMLPFKCEAREGWVLTKNAFICGTDNIKVSCRWAGCGNACCTEQGPFFTHITVKEGSGVFFAGSYGALERREVAAGKPLFVDAKHFFAARDNIKFRVGIVGGLKCCACNACSGELFVMKFVGPCVVFTRSRDPSLFDRISKGNQEEENKKNANTANNIASLI